MTSDEFKGTLRDLLYEACHSYVNELMNDLSGESIYAFAINMSDTWNITASTIEYLEKRRNDEQLESSAFKEPSFYLEMAGAEWNYFGNHEELFTSVNEQINFLNSVAWGEALFEDINPDMNIDQILILTRRIIIDVIVDVLSNLKQEGVFKNDSFVKDLYLGVQYSDPTEQSFKTMKEISNKLNSKVWHSKTEEYINYYS